MAGPEPSLGRMGLEQFTLLFSHYLFIIYLTVWSLSSACRIFMASCRIFHCGAQTV